MPRSIPTGCLISCFVIICGLCGNVAVATNRKTLHGDAGSTTTIAAGQWGSRRELLQGVAINGNRFPYVVSIRQTNGAHLCSGALVSKEWVLTAGRCWEMIFEYPLIHIGVEDAGSDSRRQEVRLAKKMVPEIGAAVNATSLGLIQLNASVDVPIPRLSSKPAEPLEKSQVIGFGNVGVGGTSFFAGMQVEKHVIQHNDFCQKKWTPSELGETGFCTSNEDGLSSCVADSGSPVIRPNGIIGGDPLLDPLIGIVVGGGICGFDEDKPETIAIDVHENTDWILSHTQEKASSSERPISIFLILGLVAGLLGVVLVVIGGYAVKSNWSKLFPPMEPPEPWLVVEDSAKILEGSEGDESKKKMKSPFHSASRPPEMDAPPFPTISRSLRATRLCPCRKIINSGQFGCVEKGQFVDAAGVAHDVAVKVAKMPIDGDASHVSDTFLAEMECFEKIPPHPNIIQCFGGRLGTPTDSAMDCNEIFIVEELMDANLRDIITGKSKPWDTWTYEIVLRIFKDIAEGLEHLHAHNVSHYDLKPENVLVKVVDEAFPLQIKLADFGCSQIKQKTYATAKYAGTKHYMAPEIAWSHYFSLTASSKIDVYSLGILMWEVLTGESLTARVVQTVDETQMVTIEKALDFPEQLWPIAEHHPVELSKLIWSCLEFHSSKRPTTERVIKSINCLMQADWVSNEIVRKSAVIELSSG